jgi:hypothetical protein
MSFVNATRQYELVAGFQRTTVVNVKRHSARSENNELKSGAHGHVVEHTCAGAQINSFGCIILLPRRGIVAFGATLSGKE